MSETEVVSEKIVVELCFPPRGAVLKYRWQRLQGHYPDAIAARADIAGINRRWAGKTGHPTGYRILRIATEIIEEVIHDES